MLYYTDPGCDRGIYYSNIRSHDKSVLTGSDGEGRGVGVVFFLVSSADRTHGCARIDKFIHVTGKRQRNTVYICAAVQM